jgi:hypothetical protein
MNSKNGQVILLRTLNMEMGVRVLGPPARSIADHFDLLISNGVLEPFEVETTL